MTMLRMKTDATSRKVLGATAGAGVAGALTTILIWVLQHPDLLALEVPADVAAALTTVISAVATYYFGYYTLPDVQDQVIEVSAADEGVPG